MVTFIALQSRSINLIHISGSETDETLSRWPARRLEPVRFPSADPKSTTAPQELGIVHASRVPFLSLRHLLHPIEDNEKSTSVDLTRRPSSR